MDSISILIFLGIVPIIFILLFVYTKDKNREPVKLLLGLFFLGIISCLGVALLTYVIPPIDKYIKNEVIRLLFYVFIKIALIEEIFKWNMVYLFGYKNKEFDELYDIVVYSVFVSLGFAFLENMLFIFRGGSITSILSRAVLSIPGHTCFAIFMGYYLCMARISKKNGNNNSLNIILSIIIPVLLHGVYDYCLMSNSKEFIYIFIIFIISLYMISYFKLINVIHLDKKNKINNKFCIECGSLVKDGKCIKCGKINN